MYVVNYQWELKAFSNGVDHRRPDVAVAQELLDRADIVIGLKEMSCKAVPKGVRRDV